MNIVFDLDGTLIDSAPDIQFAASTVLARHGKEELTLEETRSFIGEGAAVFVSRMMASRAIAETAQAHASIHADFLVEYEASVEKAEFYPGVQSALMSLKDNGYSLGLCTNKPELPARAVVRHMGIESIFDAFIAGGMVERSKPEPDMLLKTIEQLGGGTTLYVGDSETDAVTAKRAAIPFALYSEGYRKSAVVEIHHDWVFDDFDLLPGIVEEYALRPKPKIL